MSIEQAAPGNCLEPGSSVNDPIPKDCCVRFRLYRGRFPILDNRYHKSAKLAWHPQVESTGLVYAVRFPSTLRYQPCCTGPSHIDVVAPQELLQCCTECLVTVRYFDG